MTDEHSVQKALAAKQIQAYKDAADGLLKLIAVAKKYDKKVINKRFFDEAKAVTGLYVCFDTSWTGPMGQRYLNISYQANDRYVSDKTRTHSIPYANIACERAGWGVIRSDDLTFFSEDKRLEADGLTEYLKRGARYLCDKAQALKDGLKQLDRYLDDQARIYAAYEAFRREVAGLGAFAGMFGLDMEISHTAYTARAMAQHLGLVDIKDPAEAFSHKRE
jgi:hypothetical protein